MIAKAVMWGQVGEIPSSHAHSELLDVSQFFTMKCFNFRQLINLPLLEKAKAEYMQKYEEENQRLRTRLSEMERVNELSDSKVEREVPIEVEQLNAEAIREQNRAEKWKLVTLIVGAVALIELIPTVQAFYR